MKTTLTGNYVSRTNPGLPSGYVTLSEPVALPAGRYTGVIGGGHVAGQYVTAPAIVSQLVFARSVEELVAA